MAVDPNELEKIIEKAGLGTRSAKKLRDANGGDAAPKPAAARGHGAAAPIRRMAGAL